MSASMDRPGRLVTVLPAAGVIVVTLLVLHAGSMTPGADHVGPVQMASVFNGTNGIVQLNLSQLGPSVTVGSPGGGAPYRLSTGLSSLQEIGVNGSAVAVGNFSSTGWTVDNQSTPDLLEVAYSADMLVDRHSGANTSNPAQIAYVVSVPGGGSVDASQAANVTISITIVNWPWQHPKDALALQFPLEPADSSQAALADGPTNTMNCVETDSNATRETVTWGSMATAVDASGDHIPLTPSAAVFGSASAASLEVLLPGGGTGYVDLSYVLTVAVVVPGTGVSLPADEVVLAVLAAGVIGGLMAVQLRENFTARPDGGDGGSEP